MSQYQPQQGNPAPQPSPFGQQQQPPQAPQGYGQPPPQQFGQASYGQQAPPPGYQPGFHAPPAEPGLFDVTFAKPTTPKVAKMAFFAIIVVAGVLVLTGLLSAIASFSLAASYGDFGGGASSVLVGIGQLLTGGALGFAVLTLGRLAVEYFVETHKARQLAASKENS